MKLGYVFALFSLVVYMVVCIVVYVVVCVVVCIVVCDVFCDVFCKDICVVLQDNVAFILIRLRLYPFKTFLLRRSPGHRTTSPSL